MCVTGFTMVRNDRGLGPNKNLKKTLTSESSLNANWCLIERLSRKEYFCENES